MLHYILFRHHQITANFIHTYLRSFERQDSQLSQSLACIRLTAVDFCRSQVSRTRAEIQQGNKNLATFTPFTQPPISHASIGIAAAWHKPAFADYYSLVRRGPK